MEKIVYVLTSNAHRRVFETLVPISGIEQLVVGPQPTITSGIVPEDYSDFRIGIKTYRNISEMNKIIDNFSPNIYVQSDLSSAHKIRSGCKRVLAHHGAIGNHVVGMASKISPNTGVWKGFDLYCGANNEFIRLVQSFNGSDSNITVNASPQFDIIYNKEYYESYRKMVLGKIGFSGDKVICYVGFCCKDRIDFDDHNEDYFKTVINLEEIASRNNWLIMVKPRQTYGAMMKFLRSHNWGKKYISKYSEIQKSKFLHFITTTGHIYRYFFANAFIINGSSTVELEVCATNKPLIIARTHNSAAKKFDPYMSVNAGAAELITNQDDLEKSISENLNRHDREREQNKLLNYHGITFDGNMHKRLQDSIIELL